MKIQESETLYARAEIEGNTLGDEIVFFDDRVGKYFATGSVGADIWKMLETPMSLDAIVTKLLQTYDVDEDTCRSETEEFVVQMVRVALMEKL